MKFLNRFPNDIYCPEQDFINYHLAENIRIIPNNYNLMFTDPHYLETAPVMIHYLGKFKPWSEGSAPAGVGHYFRRYLAEAEKNAEFLTVDFINKIKKNVDFYIC